MTNILQFPKRQDNRRDARQVATGKDEAGQPIIGFKADLFLENGRDVAFTLSYPYCSLSKGLIAAMLRQAAKIIEDCPNRRV
jgi:hypothetical protein